MEASACREQLATILAQHVATLGELAVLLDREHAHLSANEVTALETVMRERHQCVARLVRADEERRSLCRAVSHEPDMQGMERLLRWCDPRGTLVSAWSQCAVTAAQCRMLNDRNGALVSARLKHVQARLAALIKDRKEPVTYGRQGNYATSSLGRVLATEA